jgi:hypothetical protein
MNEKPQIMDARNVTGMRTPELVREYARHRVQASLAATRDQFYGQTRSEVQQRRLEAVVNELIARGVLD